MSHPSRFWKSPLLIDQFERYREQDMGDVGSLLSYPDLVDPAEPRFAHDLVVEARGLLRRNKTLVYPFSDATVRCVAPYSEPGQKLVGASVAHNLAERTYSFTRLYDVSVSLRDILRKQELAAIAQDYDDLEFVDDGYPELSMEAEMEAAAADDALYHTLTDTFFEDAFLADRSKLIVMHADGATTEHTRDEFCILDAMALGYLIEYSGFVEPPL